jgi:cation transporter-like permease
MGSMFATLTPIGLWTAYGSDIWSVVQNPAVIAVGVAFVVGLIGWGIAIAMRIGSAFTHRGRK